MTSKPLIEYATTDKQREVAEAVSLHGSEYKAAEALGLSRGRVNGVMLTLKKRAALHGDSPDHDLTNPTAPGFATKRVSTNYGPDGEIKQQWHIQEPEKDAVIENLLARLDEIEYKPAPNIKTKGPHSDALLTLYTLTDFHMGMYAYAPETGDDWDVDIAVKEMISAIIRMAEGSPNSLQAILNLQGDFLHWDGLLAVTPTSKHILDADTRYGRLIDLMFYVVTTAIEILLKRHKLVVVIICEGNHDEAGSAWIRKALKQVFRNNKRITVDDTEFPYYAYLHGEIMLGFHHGHKTANKSLPSLFASEPRYRQMWGAAKYTYIHTGHYHKVEQDQAEHGGAIVERHPTLAASDAYAARGGWVSWRACHAITYHKTSGEVARVTVSPQGEAAQ